MRSPDASLIAVAAALVLGAGLRAYGLDFPVTYGPDQEPSVARAIRHLNGDLHPRFFNYPSFFPYLLAALSAPIVAIGGLPVPPSVAPILQVSLSLEDGLAGLVRPFYLIARAVTATMGVATIWLVYRTGVLLYGRVAGAIAALGLALAPLHIWDSHYATVDVPAAFWVAAAALAAAKALPGLDRRWLFVSGLMAGLAAGTKYPSGVALVFPIVVVVWHVAAGRERVDARTVPRGFRTLVTASGVALLVGGVVAWTMRPQIAAAATRASAAPGLPQLIERGVLLLLVAGAVLTAWSALLRFRPGFAPSLLAAQTASHRGAVMAVAAAAVAFILVVPHAILDPRAVANGVYAEMLHTAEGHYGFEAALGRLPYVRGLYFLLAGFPFALGLPLYALSVAGLLVALARRRPGDWLVTGGLVALYAVSGLSPVVFLRYLVPMLPLVMLLAGRAGAVLLEPRAPGARRLGGAVLVAILAYTGVYAWSTTARYAQDTRTQAAAELPDLVPAGATLAWYGGLSNYYPNVSASRYQLRTCDNPGPGAATGCGADFVLLSGMTIWRPYRGPMIYHEAYENFEALRGGETGYELVRVWRSGYLNQELYARLDPMYEGYFVAPRIELYRRRR